MKRSIFRRTYFLIVALVLSASLWAKADSLLTKKAALELMKKNGFKWKQTELLTAQAQAQKQQANSYSLPHINGLSREQGGNINQLELGYSTSANLGYYTVGITAIEASYSIYDKTAVERLNAANANQNYFEANKAQYQLDLTYVMLAQYLNTQRLRRKLEIIDDNIKRDHALFETAKAKVDAGVGLKIDLMRAQGLVEYENLKHLDTQTGHKKAEQELAVLLGSTDLNAELPNWKVTKIKAVAAVAPDQRPDVRSAKSLIQVSHHLVELARGESYPKFSAFTDMGVVGTHIIGGFGNALSGSAGLQVTFPIFEGGLLQGAEEEASVKLTQASLQAQQLNLEVNSQIANSREQLKNADEALQVTDRQINIAQEELRLAEQRFRSGSSSGLELSSAQTSVSTAHDSQLEAQFGYEMAKLNFYKAAGDFSEYLDDEREQP